MSNQYFTTKWKTSINQLMEGLTVESDPLVENQQKDNLKYVRSDQEWFRYYGKLYLFYVDSYKALEDCYDQVIHPQKRKILKKMLENNMLRMLQVKQNLIFYSTTGNAIRSDYVNLHEIMNDEKRLLQSAEVGLPRFFASDITRKKTYRDQMINKLMMEFHDTNQPEIEELGDGKRIEDDGNMHSRIDMAIWSIQKLERGRQGIMRVYFAKYLRKLDLKKFEKQKRLQEGGEVGEDTEREEAVIVIQKYFNGFKAREIVWKMRQEEELFLGFKREKPLEETQDYQMYIKNRELMKNKQQERMLEYKNALLDAKEALMNNWTDDIQSNMLDDRRKWYMQEVYKAEGKKVPAKVAQFYDKDKVRLPLTEEEQEALDLADKEKKAAKKNKTKKKKKKKGVDEDPRVEQGPTETVVKLQDIIQQHNSDWRGELQNFEQKHEPKLLNNEIAKEVEKQIKSVVDDMIDMELVNLRLALKAKKFKYPKKKKSKKKKKKEKKLDYDEDILDQGEILFEPRSVTKKKKRMPGDKHTAKKDPRDMLAELIEAGVVKKLEPAKLSDLVGDPNPMRNKLELLQEQVADPSMFDLRQALIQFVGMPLGSPYIKDNIKESNYILFYGPHGSGKSHAIRALHTECDSLLIDLSVENIKDKYSNEPEKLLNLAFKVATCFQPSIIYIDEVDWIFKGKKKKKKGEAPIVRGSMNWVKFRKFLIKYGKYFTDKGRENVAVIGCTNAPWSANKKQLKSFFKRRIYFPCPDYTTRMLIFKKFFEQSRIDLHPNFPLSTLAMITEGFTAGNIKEAMKKILTERRILLTNELPFRIGEFVDPLSNQHNTYQQKYLEFRKFHDEFSGNKARIDKLKKPEEDEKGKKKPAKKPR